MLISPHRGHVHQDHLLDLRPRHSLQLSESGLELIRDGRADLLPRVLVERAHPVKINLWQV